MTRLLCQLFQDMEKMSIFRLLKKKKCWEINIENILLDRSLLFFHVQIMIWRLLLLSSAYIVSDLLNTSVPLLIMLMRWWRWESDYFPLPSLMCGKKLFSPECYWRKRRERERRRIRSYSYANDYNRVSKWQTMLCLWIEIDMNKVILHRTDELLIEDFAFFNLVDCLISSFLMIIERSNKVYSNRSFTSIFDSI